MHFCRLILLGFSHRDIVYALKSHFQVLLPFLEFETVEGPKCFLTLLVTLLCHSFLWLRFKQAAVEKRLKGVGKYGICFPHFFSRKKRLLLCTLPSPSFCLHGALHTLGARDFSSAVSGFCQVLKVTRAKDTAEDVSSFGQHRKVPPYSRKASATQGTRCMTTLRTTGLASPADILSHASEKERVTHA